MNHRYNVGMSESCYKLYTARQVRALDDVAIGQFGIAGYELMCWAGKAVVDIARSQYPLTGHWLVVCGSGNNAGDGYVVARLAVEAGLDVTLCALTDAVHLKGDAALAQADWQAAGGKITPWPLSGTRRFDLVFDALLGTGINRELSGEYRKVIKYLNLLDCPRIAIDIPSGLNADTGCVMGAAIRAQNTVTFVGRKRGLYTADGPDHCGLITFEGLAIPAEAAEVIHKDSGSPGTLLQTEFLKQVIKPRLRNSHKGSYGHVLAVGGGPGMSGAIRLCGEAALRSGAGRVTVVTATEHRNSINLSRPELMVSAVEHGEQLSSLLSGNSAIVPSVIAIGPGLGRSEWSESLLQTCLVTDVPLVVDADGLNLIAEQTRENSISRKSWILTPHPAEAARLLDCRVTEIQSDRVTAAQNIARCYGTCVVLKGCGTVVADQSGEYSICPEGNPGMATAGSGDVLTGIIAALMGQGMSQYEAAMAGVIAHAQAGDLAAEKLGESALVAGDITDHLSSVWKAAMVGE